MSARKVALYYAWSRPGEIGAPLQVLENRFPALFEVRRLLYPRFQELADPARFDQSIAGFLDYIMKANFRGFVERTTAQTGNQVVEIERVGNDGHRNSLDGKLLDGIDTLIVIGFDSFRTDQMPDAGEVTAVRAFLDDPDHIVFVCPHHDIGDVDNVSDDERLRLREEEFLHHGDRSIPSQQRFGGFERSLLAALGVPVENRFGLRPAKTADGLPAPVEVDRGRDRLNLLNGVSTFNLHPHLPHLQRLVEANSKLDVLVRQSIDPDAPPHEFVRSGNSKFDALLQSRPEVFGGTLLVSDATLWSSTAGGLDSLHRFWSNVVTRPKPE